MAEERVKLTVRLPATVHRALKERARRERRISQQTLRVGRARLMADAQAFPEMLTVSRDIVEWASDLTIAHSLRAYDAVHLAAARSEGLRAANPNDQA